MPEKSSDYFRRKATTIDNYLFHAIETMYELMYIYLRFHPNLGLELETLILETNIIRAKLRDFYIRNWHHDLKCYDTIKDIAALVTTAREDVEQETGQCLTYSVGREALRRVLSETLSRLDVALRRLSASSDPSHLISQNRQWYRDTVKSDSQKN